MIVSDNKKIPLKLTLKSKAIGIYHKIPNYLRILLLPPKYIYRFYKLLRREIFIISGNEKTSQKNLKIIFSGCKEDKNYFINLAFDEAFQEKYLGKKWIWKIPGILNKNQFNFSLAIVEIPRSFRALADKFKSFFVPSWISGEIDAPINKSSLFRHKNTSLKSDQSKIKKNNLQYEIKNDLSSLNNFYYHMYLPYLNNTHGDGSIIMHYNFVKREFKKKGRFKDLLLIKKNEKYIGGVLLCYKNNWAQISSIGIKDGNMDYVADGAIAAICYYSIKYFEDNGISKICLGASRPFLKDGVLRYKRKWQPKIYNDKKNGFFFRILSETEGVKNFLLHNPFIYEDKAGLNGAIFTKADQPISKKVFSDIIKKYYMKGLLKIVIYQLRKKDNSNIVPQEYSDIIKICSADEFP